jgi:hypothetical protein
MCIMLFFNFDTVYFFRENILCGNLYWSLSLKDIRESFYDIALQTCQHVSEEDIYVQYKTEMP